MTGRLRCSRYGRACDRPHREGAPQGRHRQQFHYVPSLFTFAKVICRANADQYTVAIGLWKMLEKEYIDNWYTCFAVGAVLISIPIAILFLRMQKYYVNGLGGGVKG